MSEKTIYVVAPYKSQWGAKGCGFRGLMEFKGFTGWKPVYPEQIAPVDLEITVPREQWPKLADAFAEAWKNGWATSFGTEKPAPRQDCLIRRRETTLTA